jgi:RND family efflux transporter MFP subunit
LSFAKHQMDTQPQAKRKKTPRQARVVTVTTAQQETVDVLVQARGTVVAAQTVTVSPEVSGRVVAMHPDLIPGGMVQAGQELIRIDVRDYDYMLQQRRSEVARAELNLRLEQGNQMIARHEYELLQDQVSEQERDLVLREPYLASVQAAVKASKSSVDKALLDVNRCKVTAPFNGIIQSKYTELGGQVSPATHLLTLTGTDVYWVEAMVKVDDLKWIQIRQKNGELGSKVRVYDKDAWGKGVFREGRVSKLLPDVQDKGRMAKLLVVIEDPLALTPAHVGQAQLLLNTYVKVEIQGKPVANAIVVPRAILHDETLWVMTDASQLAIRPVEIAHKGRELVLITGGVTAGERLVTTNIAAPIDGMALRLDSGPSAQSGKGPSTGREDHD